MKASIDSEKCQGHARCWEICPEVFSLDEQGYGMTSDEEIPAELEAKAREAELNCPERAITVA